MPVTAVKKQKVEKFKSLLSSHSNFVLTSCVGLGVPQQNEVRAELRSKGAVFKVIKNRIFQLALKEAGGYTELEESLSKDLNGPVTVAFSAENFSVISKLLLEYDKKIPGLKVKSGCFEGAYMDLGGVKEMACLPSREELLTVIARGLNAPATKIAMGLREVMVSLARGIKAVGEKND